MNKYGKARFQYYARIAVATTIVFLCFVTYSMISNNAGKSLELVTSKSATNNRRLEFVHITKTGGSAIEIEKAGAQTGIIWAACHYMNVSDVGCFNPDINYISSNYQSIRKLVPGIHHPKIRRHNSA